MRVPYFWVMLRMRRGKEQAMSGAYTIEEARRLMRECRHFCHFAATSFYIEGSEKYE